MTGKQQPHIKRELEDDIVKMFNMIDRMWSSIERERCKTFLSYYYILLKLPKLMGQTELLPQVPLLRTRLHVRQHDLLSKKVCDELGWA